MEQLILIVLSGNGLRDPDKLAKSLGLRSWRVRRAWGRLRDKRLIVPRSDSADGSDPIYEASAEGRALAKDALMAAEVAEFEPEYLRSLRASDTNSLSHMKRPGGL